MSDHLDLLERYLAVRQAQRDYFRNRTAKALENSKALEAALDRDVIIALQEAGRIKPPAQPEPTLF
jgi:hypothetical protein